MNRTLLGLGAGLALGLMLALGVKLGAASPPQEGAQQPAAEEAPLVRLALAHQRPVWNTLNLEDKVPALLVRVPEGERFVLTDVWLLTHERLPVGVSGSDRLWLESVNGGERKVVFDQFVGEFEQPIRWQTGVAFTPGQEAWVAYTFANEKNKRPRRLHYTGYFEPLDPQVFEVRLER